MGQGVHRHPRGRRRVLGGEAVLLLRPRQRAWRSRCRSAPPPCCCRTARRPRRCSTSCAGTSRPSSTACRRSMRRMLAHEEIGTRRRLRPPAALRLGGRGAAGATRRALARAPPASTSSTASARPKCSTPFSATGPATSATAPPASRCPATSSRSSMSTAASVADGEIGELLVRGPTAGEGYWNQRDKSRAHLRRRMDPYRRQVLSRRRRLLPLLRAHRRHVQGQRHVGVAVRGRGRARLARGGARGRRHRQGGCRRPDQAEGVHRAASDGYAADDSCSRSCACT